MAEQVRRGDDGAPERFQAMMRAADWDPRVSEPIVALLRADSRVTGALDRSVAGAGLTLPKFNVLMELAEAPGGQLPLHQIRRILVKSAPNITSLTDRLGAEGLLRRRRDSADRRVVMAQITERGWKKLEGATPSLLAAERRLVHGLSATDRRTLASLLQRVATVVQED